MSKEYYKYEERNLCPKCKGKLSLVGSISNHEYYECIDCKTGIKVLVNNKIVDNHTEFVGYVEEKIYD